MMRYISRAALFAGAFMPLSVAISSTADAKGITRLLTNIAKDAFKSIGYNMTSEALFNMLQRKACPDANFRRSIDEKVMATIPLNLEAIDGLVVAALGCRNPDFQALIPSGSSPGGPQSPSARDEDTVTLLKDDKYPICSDSRNITGALPGRAPAERLLAIAAKASKVSDFATAYQAWSEVDREGEAAILALPPSLPNIDVIIDKQVNSISIARAMIAYRYRSINPTATTPDDRIAAVWYLKSFNTKVYFEDRNCQVSGLPIPLNNFATDYALMYIYGQGVPRSPITARNFLAKLVGEGGSNLIPLIDHDALPPTYSEYLQTDFRPVLARINRQ